MNFKLRKFRFLPMYAISLIIISCGMPPSDSAKINAPIQKIEVDSPEGPAQIIIKASSSGLQWKLSYSLALDSLFSETEFINLFNTKISQTDLDLINCPNFNSFNTQSKKYFYTTFLAAIAEAESDFEVNQKTYNPADQTMNVGLLQIDPASANRHSGDYFNQEFNENDLTNPELNLMIGAFILKNQITGKIAANKLFPVKTYYWQVLSGSRKRVLKNLQTNLRFFSQCRSTALEVIY